jgi:hypothetical protein
MTAYVDLFWLPLGAGGHFVRLNGRLYEALAARRAHRPRRALYHSALEVGLDGERYAIEMGPVWNERSPERGVVGEGPVGSPHAGRLRAFRYEIRCWRGGRIPDAAEAVDSPRRLTTDPAVARELLGLVAAAPPLTWGRDELHTGDMWNSNSLVAWLLVRSGLHGANVNPPAGGRAPGWEAGLALARRERTRSHYGRGRVVEPDSGARASA